MFRFSDIVFRGSSLLIVFLFACSGTRPDNLGIQNKQLSPCPESPNCVSSYANDEEHQVQPFRFSASPETVLQELKNHLASLDRVRIVTLDDQYVYAEFSSFLMGYVDDVEFLLLPQEKVLHFRSASRLGYGDMGVNRERIEAIRSHLKSKFQ